MSALLILIPFLVLIFLNLPLRRLMNALALWLVLALALFQVCLVIFPQSFSWVGNLGFFNYFLKFSPWVDGLTLVMLVATGIVIFVSAILGNSVIGEKDKRFNFFSLLLIVLAGINGIVMARDVFTLYVFLEITAAASFIMIAFNKDVWALEGAFKYIVFSTVASVLMLLSIALILLAAGSVEFNAINLALKNSGNSHFIMLAAGLFTCGLLIKSGMMPFHGWLPDAYSAAPATVSVLLAGIVTKAVGVYALMRVTLSVFIFTNSLQQVLLLVATISICLGALAALGQSDFKRMLAYSSISQMGYIILGLGAGTPLGVAGAVFHLFNHSIFKSLLFVNALAVEKQSGTRDMDKMSGLASKMPFTGLTSVLGSLSAAGVPPLAGFFSKLMIIIALWVSGKYIYAAIAIGASIITLAYFLSLQRRVFWGKLREDFSNIKEAGPGIIFPAILLASITLLAGIFFFYLLNNYILPCGNFSKG